MNVTPEEWRKRGREIDLRDGRIFVVEKAGAAGTPVLVLHGEHEWVVGEDEQCTIARIVEPHHPGLEGSGPRPS